MVLLAGQVPRFRGELLFDLARRIGGRRTDSGEFLLQALLPGCELRQRVPDAVAPGLGHAHVLFHQCDFLREVGEHPRGLCHRLFERRQQRLRRTLSLRGGFARGERRFEFALGIVAVAGQRGVLPGDGAQCLGQLRNLLGQACFRFTDETELLFQARDFGIGGVERALLLVQRIAGRIVIGAQRFEPAFGRAKLGLQRLERHGQRGHFGRASFANADGVLLLGEPQQVLRLLVAPLQFAVLGGHPRLRFEADKLVAKFQPDVLDARQVLAGIGQPTFRFLAALLVLGHARGFLEEYAQFFRLGLDDPRDHPLFDDRVGARPQARAQEQVVDVAPTYRNIVDVVRRIAIAAQHAFDRDFGVLAPLAADPALAVVEMQFDRRTADRLALAGTVEDDVLHRLAAQRRRLRLAQHPAHGVDDIGFAAAVGTDDADQLAGRRDSGRVDERLEPGELDLR